MSPSFQSEQSQPAVGRKDIIDSILEELQKTLNRADTLTPIPVHTADTEADSVPPDSASCASRNPAIRRCILAHNQAMQSLPESKFSTYDIRSKGKLAFREALPPLIGRNNIRNFIACVTYGMAIGVISSDDCVRLLTAARAASTVRDRRSHHKAKQNAPQSAPKAGKAPLCAPKIRRKS